VLRGTCLLRFLLMFDDACRCQYKRKKKSKQKHGNVQSVRYRYAIILRLGLLTNTVKNYIGRYNYLVILNCLLP
jgi:hypothetical protein